MITVEMQDETTFCVTVAAQSTTTHTVTVQVDYSETLTQRAATTERLIEASFEFLLEREPNTSILREFDLPVIGRYFPEYESSIRNLL
jgi:hypothetical protein